MKPKDSESRRIALTDLGRTLLVEAGAGSGKTALLAGRIAYMLASGIQPRNVVAVTFTEMAASELRERLERYVAQLEQGRVPKGLDTAFGAEPSAAQRKRLSACKAELDDIVCTTIHGFCQRMLRPYPAEANIDPGARILDEKAAEMLFEEAFASWVKERLSGHDPERDIVTYLATELPDHAFGLFRELAFHMRPSDSIRPDDATLDPGAITAFRVAAEEFSEFCGGLGFSAEGNDEILAAFAQVAEGLAALDLGKPHVAAVKISRAPLPTAIGKADGGLRAYRMKGKWTAAAPSKKEGEAANERATACYEKCAQAYALLKETAAAAGLAMLAREIRPLIGRYAEMKEKGAYLDFDDLISATRRMLRQHRHIRAALAERHLHILVDEFQDTDEVQFDIFKHLAFEDSEGEWTPKPGAIFLVGDPKQAIYRFRGADVATYVEARELLLAHDPACVIEVSTNFRSRKGILDYVNATFRAPLEADGQPGFTDLDAFRQDQGSVPSVMRFAVPEFGYSSETRQEEARLVADMCARMIGSLPVHDGGAGMRPCRASDIALLAPTGTELWRYESALEDAGIPVSTQAGKGMFQRQEVHDLLALTRAIADQRDTLALGALLRGPLVGLTDAQLLDASMCVPDRDDGSLRFLRVGMDTSPIREPILKDTLDKLATLQSRAHATSPHSLLSEAVDLFHVRPLLKLRHPRSPERALANVDRFLELSLAYESRGLRQFSDEMRRLWEDGARQVEGRPDSEGDAVSLITMHSSKGLEWPVVIPVNALTDILRPSSTFVENRTGRLFAPFMKAMGPSYLQARQQALHEDQCERVRLWYVAATRARDLLILPRYAKVSDKSWAGVVNFVLEDIVDADLTGWPAEFERVNHAGTNDQDERAFGAEAFRIALAARPVIWTQPSRVEHSHSLAEDLTWDEVIDSVPEADPLSMIRGGAHRGDILHKLMEEVLFGETGDSENELQTRAGELVAQYVAWKPDCEASELRPEELARTVRKALSVPEVAAIRPRLRPEVAVYGFNAGDAADFAMAGVADALEEMPDGSVGTVVDWKSDMRPTKEVTAAYIDQVRKYLKATGSKRGLLVFMTTGRAVEVLPATA